MQSFDLIVIGSGSGLEVSAQAARRGLSVAVVESGPFGGTCLNRGCIPSKMLVYTADVMETIRRAPLFGLKTAPPEADWRYIKRRVFETIDAEARSIEEANRRHPRITVFKGNGRFVDHKVLDVGGEQITAETIVIAAGSRPRIPPIDGLEDVPFVTSDDVMRLDDRPRRMAMLGGGYISAELAHFFGALGTRVSIIEQEPLLLPGEDDDISERFTEVYERRFDLHVGSTITQVRRNGHELLLRVRSNGTERTLSTDVLMLAIGRAPNSDILDVEKTGVEVDDKGFVKTDEYLETNVPGIWALGDIVGRYMLKHNANLEAVHVAHNIFSPEKRARISYRGMPHAVFASPQVAGVGLTEREAQRRHLDYAVGVYDYHDTAYGSSIEDHEGFVKVIAARETRDILGCHIIGTEASVLIQEAAIAIRARLPTTAITQSIYVHPALPEVVQRAFLSVRF